MSDLTTKLSASILTASLPLGEILARLRRGNETIERLSECLDRARDELRQLSEVADRQQRLITRQREEINLMRAHIQILQAKERKRLSLVVDHTPALLRPQGE